MATTLPAFFGRPAGRRRVPFEREKSSERSPPGSVGVTVRGDETRAAVTGSRRERVVVRIFGPPAAAGRGGGGGGGSPCTGFSRPPRTRKIRAHVSSGRPSGGRATPSSSRRRRPCRRRRPAPRPGVRETPGAPLRPVPSPHRRRAPSPSPGPGRPATTADRHRRAATTTRPRGRSVRVCVNPVAAAAVASAAAAAAVVHTAPPVDTLRYCRISARAPHCRVRLYYCRRRRRRFYWYCYCYYYRCYCCLFLLRRFDIRRSSFNLKKKKKLVFPRTRLSRPPKIRASVRSGSDSGSGSGVGGVRRARRVCACAFSCLLLRARARSLAPRLRFPRT